MNSPAQRARGKAYFFPHETPAPHMSTKALSLLSPVTVEIDLAVARTDEPITACKFLPHGDSTLSYNLESRAALDPTHLIPTARVNTRVIHEAEGITSLFRVDEERVSVKFVKVTGVIRRFGVATPNPFLPIQHVPHVFTNKVSSDVTRRGVKCPLFPVLI